MHQASLNIHIFQSCKIFLELGGVLDVTLTMGLRWLMSLFSETCFSWCFGQGSNTYYIYYVYLYMYIVTYTRTDTDVYVILSTTIAGFRIPILSPHLGYVFSPLQGVSTMKYDDMVKSKFGVSISRSLEFGIPLLYLGESLTPKKMGGWNSDIYIRTF